MGKAALATVVSGAGGHRQGAHALARKRRRPETTVLHQVVRAHRATFFAEAATRTSTGAGYPRYVAEEFSKYERCGILAYGFVRVRCDTCGESEVVGFSCKGRAICPSCTGRRMADVTSHLVDEVLPHAPYRQWTLSFPWRVRLMLVQHPALVTALQRVLVQAATRYLRQRAKAVLAVRGEPAGGRLVTGAVVAIQRFGSRLNLHVHCHAVIPDAVWRERDGVLERIALPAPTDDDVADIARRICRRSMAVVARWQERGELAAPETDDDAGAVAELVLGDMKQAPTVDEEAATKPVKPRRLASYVDGYSLECAPNVGEHDRAGLERLLRYGARPAFAHERLELLPSGQVSYRLPKPFYTGQTHVVLSPLDFLRRLAALLPPPRVHTIRYHGLFAPHAKFRAQACALAPKAAVAVAAGRCVHDPTAGPRAEASAESPKKKHTRTLWADLLRRTFEQDVRNCPCGGKRLVIGVLSRAQTPEALARYLAHIGEPTEPPLSAPARAPPQAELDFDDASSTLADRGAPSSDFEGSDPMPDYD